MKIYTRTGDNGTTGLIGGRRVRKSDPRLECYGTVDELNAALGLAVAAPAAAPAGDPATSLLPAVREVQSDLFVIGSHLATPDDSPHRESVVATMRRRLHDVFSLRANGLAHAALYRELAAARRSPVLDPYATATTSALIGYSTVETG